MGRIPIISGELEIPPPTFGPAMLANNAQPGPKPAVFGKFRKRRLGSNTSPKLEQM